jgi:hypothetical protein
MSKPSEPQIQRLSVGAHRPFTTYRSLLQKGLATIEADSSRFWNPPWALQTDFEQNLLLPMRGAVFRTMLPTNFTSCFVRCDDRSQCPERGLQQFDFSLKMICFDP